MEPADLAALVEAWHTKVQREDRRLAYVTTMLANRYRAEGDAPFHVADFFPSLEEHRHQPTEEEVEDKIAAVFGAMKG